MRPEVSPSAASSASAFLENAATQLMGSFTSPKEAELLMEARRLKEEEKNKERMAKLRKEKEAVLRCRVVLIGGSGVGKGWQSR
jgi:polynucleotide 5'-kinase involved in rRNA processing